MERGGEIMASSAEEVYEHAVKSLPLSERLRLAALILNAIPPQAVVDYSDSWSDEDIREFTAASWRHIDAQLEDEERNAESG
jgi:hypothetical protein